MKENESALFSRYIIDGIQQDATPYELLAECMDGSVEMQSDQEYADIIDESTDPPVTSFTYDSRKNKEYIGLTAWNEGQERPFRMLYPATFTKQRIARALIERLWNKGHYKLGDLELWAGWEWNSKPLGNMAAFYSSVQAASEYIYDLGCRLADFYYEGCDEESVFRIGAWLPSPEEKDVNDYSQYSNDSNGSPLFKVSPYKSKHPWIEEERACPQTLVDDPDSQIIYIPFDTASFRLGGSLLAELNGHNGGAGPHIEDPDYFIDCHEVVRELVEDGVVMAGATVEDGGLAHALDRMCTDTGVEICLKGILTSYMEEDTTKVLFSEIPGAVIQVSNQDMDYLDSQLILQDVAYYPLGSPSSKLEGISLNNEAEVTVAGILASLMNMASEGED